MPDVARCRSCNAKIFWCETSKGKRMPVDFEPAPDGNLLIQGGKVEVVKPEGVLPGTTLYMPHHATCPHAARHRKG